jgi:hypothetical protein
LDAALKGVGVGAGAATGSAASDVSAWTIHEI